MKMYRSEEKLNMLAQHIQVEKDQVPSQASDEEDVAYTINETKWPTGGGSEHTSMISVCRMQEQSINVSHVACEHKIHFTRAHKCIRPWGGGWLPKAASA